MAPEADLLRLPAEAELDLFYSFWLLLTPGLPAWAVWALGGIIALPLVTVPWLVRPKPEVAPPPSVVDERLCTGCEQCYEDCPYDAIAMVPREDADGRSALVARVDPALCVSCGICAGSCAPMGVGPAGRTGRDQLSEVKRFVSVWSPSGDDVVIIGCDRSAVGFADDVEGAAVLPVTCAGNLHTSVVEYLVRSGAGGVLIVACPERDCWNREGSKWLEQRLFHDREAELQERVDRRRVRLVHRAHGEDRELRGQLERFRTDVARLSRADVETRIDLIAECETAEGEVAAVLERGGAAEPGSGAGR
jgi:ferredoxin